MTIYLSGAVRRTVHPGIGYMLQPGMGNRLPPTGVWAADNGCFSEKTPFDPERWLKWLASFTPEERARCLFATVPDVVGDAVKTLARFALHRHHLVRLGYRVALVAQDGLERLSVPWGEFDCLFVGGTTSWKLSSKAAALAAEAKARGKWTHMGRVNSERRFRMARLDGYDSVDGTYAVFRARGGGGDRGIHEIGRWIGQEVLALAQAGRPRRDGDAG